MGTTMPRRTSRRCTFTMVTSASSQALTWSVSDEQPPSLAVAIAAVWAHDLHHGADELVAELAFPGVAHETEFLGGADVAAQVLRSSCASRSIGRIPSPAAKAAGPHELRTS